MKTFQFSNKDGEKKYVEVGKGHNVKKNIG